MGRPRKERYGRGYISYAENQRPLSEEKKVETLALLKDAKSVTYQYWDISAVVGGYVHHLGETNGSGMYGTRESQAAVEQLLLDNGWELKWTRKRQKPTKKITPADEREAFMRIMGEE